MKRSLACLGQSVGEAITRSKKPRLAKSKANTRLSRYYSTNRYTKTRIVKIAKPIAKPTAKPTWVSASHLYNYMMKDPIIDWFKLEDQSNFTHDTVSTPRNNKKSTFDFTEFIMQKGVEFEKELVKYINDNKIPVVYVSDLITDEHLLKKFVILLSPNNNCLCLYASFKLLLLTAFCNSGIYSG